VEHIRYIIDASTTKQVLFFKPFYDELVRRGHKVYVLGRRFPNCEAVANHIELPVVFFGEYGCNLPQKLYYGLERQRALCKWMGTEKFDGLLSFSNPDSIRVAYGLGIPIFNFNDLPEAEKIINLTVPLATTTFVSLQSMKD